MSNLIIHAKSEFKALGWPGKCRMQKLACKNVLSLLRLFAKQGHSGTSAPYVLDLFEKLARYETLGPLTGEPSEWTLVAEGLYQNKRCGHVFKDKDGPYDSEGIIWKDETGCYTNKDSRVKIKFPYTPKSKIKKAKHA